MNPLWISSLFITFHNFLKLKAPWILSISILISNQIPEPESLLNFSCFNCASPLPQTESDLNFIDDEEDFHDWYPSPLPPRGGETPLWYDYWPVFSCLLCCGEFYFHYSRSPSMVNGGGLVMVKIKFLYKWTLFSPSWNFKITQPLLTIDVCTGWPTNLVTFY